jgi:hypothetical protein
VGEITPPDTLPHRAHGLTSEALARSGGWGLILSGQGKSMFLAFGYGVMYVLSFATIIAAFAWWLGAASGGCFARASFQPPPSPLRPSLSPSLINHDLLSALHPDNLRLGGAVP